MLTYLNKISYLKSILLQDKGNYADSFKTDIAIFLGDFNIQNSNLNFLEKLSSKEEIKLWVNNLTSKIVLKFNENEEELSDFIFYTINP